MKFLSITKGYKTYLGCLIAIGFGVAHYFGYSEPSYVDYILLAFFGVSVRQGMKTEAQNAVAAIVPLAKDVLSQVTVQTSAKEPAVPPLPGTLPPIK